MEQLEREIERLEGRLDGGRTVDELATVRRGLGTRSGDGNALANVRIGFACKQRWEDMIGDDRVRACGGCDRPVFNLSEMTRAEAEAVLATRGLTPCVRFYRRPDGTVMTSDCPSRIPARRLAVVASSLTAAGSALALPSTALADDTVEDATSEKPETPPVETIQVVMGGISSESYEVGIMVAMPEPRPAVEWSVWGRVGAGVASEHPDSVARRIAVPPSQERSASTTDAALGAELTFGVARHGDVRLGVWGEVRTSSDAVAGAELVVEGLPPHPYSSRIGAAGSVVLRAGANDRIVTGALGFGYVGSFPRSYDPWVRWARHMVGARMVVSLNRSIDEPHNWSATLGLEIEPIGAVHAVLDLVRH